MRPPLWNDVSRQRITNDVLLRYGVPAEVYHLPLADGPTQWKVNVLAGNISIILDIISAKQSRIIRKMDRVGPERLRQQDALFMYVSQWVEWAVIRGISDVERSTIDELLDSWISIYLNLRTSLAN